MRRSPLPPFRNSQNLIEYTKDKSEPAYLTLTSLLHWKGDSQAITQAQLDKMRRVSGIRESFNDPAGLVVDSIAHEADQCLAAGDGFNFENKIVLAIATRLAAERFMTTKIADPAFIAGIKSNQTQKLLTRFKKSFPGGWRVTSCSSEGGRDDAENIHLNSFMYEPIVDMSDDHLRKLYRDVLDLK